MKKKINSGQKLWQKAKKIIPGGNMLLSKRSEMFLPGIWPTYFKKTKGCAVWDLDGNKFFDMSLMGVGCNILGYSNKEVDKSVKNTIVSGNISTLNCPEEVYLAEKMIALHPWADMVRFARSGGEANSIAVRIARAASGKDKIVICGYHGWHDWYLAANITGKINLQDHLLPGLKTSGVPKSLKNTIFTFKYNDFEALLEIINKNDIGVVKMEVSRKSVPEKNFLQKIRKICTDKNIILIFDECTSGFRETNGGLHKKFNINPDMAVFGKALGNGYAITSVIGKKDIMEAAQNTFISSTFWTERIGPTAALKTLQIMKREKSWKIISAKGNYIKKRWEDLSKKYDLNMEISGLASIPKFSFKSVNNLHYKTLITQEMLKKGFLASNLLYVSTSHSDNLIDRYIDNLDSIFEIIQRCEQGESINDYLKTEVCHSGFNRLN